MADNDDLDPTPESAAAGVSSADNETPSPAAPTGSHAFVPEEPNGFLDHGDGLSGDDLEHQAGPKSATDQGEASDEGERELVAVGAAATLARSGSAKETGAAARARQKKAKATSRQKQVAEKERRTGPVTFLRESASELQKVVYPTGQQLVNYFIVVLIFVLFIIAIVSLLDLAFGKAILAVFS